MIDWPAVLDRWVRQAKRLVRKGGGLPLIDFPAPDRSKELSDAWEFGDEGLRAATQGALASNPHDIVVRWTALSVYYELANFHGIEKEELINISLLLALAKERKMYHKRGTLNLWRAVPPVFALTRSSASASKRCRAISGGTAIGSLIAPLRNTWKPSTRRPSCRRPEGSRG